MLNSSENVADIAFTQIEIINANNQNETPYVKVFEIFEKELQLFKARNNVTLYSYL